MPLSKEWLLGFIESNGCFSIIIKKSKNSVGYQTLADFSIKLPAYEENMLKDIQTYLGIGHIYRRKNEVALKATKLEDIKKVAEFLGPLGFVSAKKRQEFENWRKCIGIIETGRHLKKEGLLEIALLRDVIHSKYQWNKKNFCHVRLDIDPCHVYHKEGYLPHNCTICWSERGIKIDVPVKSLEKQQTGNWN